MNLIFNDTILTEGKYKGQKAISVWKSDNKYFKNLEKQKLAKVFIFPEYISDLSDIEKVQTDNQNNWRGTKEYCKTYIYKHWETMDKKMTRFNKLKQLSIF